MPTRDRGLVWFAIVNRGTDVLGLRAGQDDLLQRLLQQWQVAPTIPATLTPNSPSSDRTQLGAASRNQIFYKS